VATVQTIYPAISPSGRVGMIADGETSNRISKNVLDAVGIGIGVPVFRGLNGRGITADPTAGALVGITIGNYAALADSYSQYSKAGVLTFGEIWIRAAVAVARGDQAYVTSSGAITNASSGNTILPGWVFQDTTSAAGICRISAPPGQGGGLPQPPTGFQLLKGSDGLYLKGADGAYLYGKAA
jgi:hypothetical protein